MSKVIFIFNGEKINIQCLNEDKMKDICSKYSNKINKNVNDIFFLYGGNIINLDLKYNDIINSIDKNINEMIVTVYEKEKEGLICPKCGENIKIDNKIFNNILTFNENLNETLIGLKDQIENLNKSNDITINKIKFQLKNINVILDNTIKEIKKNNEQIKIIKENYNINTFTKKEKEKEKYAIIKYNSSKYKLILDEKESEKSLNNKIYKLMKIHPFFQNFSDDSNFAIAQLNNFDYNNGYIISLNDKHSFTIKNYENEKNFSFNIYLTQNDSIEQIKEKIKQKIDIPINIQILYFKGIELKDNNKTLIDYNEENNNKLLSEDINEKNEIILSFKEEPKINILISIDDKIERFSINPLITLDELYTILEKRIGKQIDIYENLLVYNGDNNEYLFKNNKQLYFYQIKNNDVLDLIKTPPFVIFYNLEEKIDIIYCNPSDQIMKIKKIIQDKTGITPNQQMLTLDGITKLEDQKTLKDYNIDLEQTIYMKVL